MSDKLKRLMAEKHKAQASAVTGDLKVQSPTELLADEKMLGSLEGIAVGLTNVARTFRSLDAPELKDTASTLEQMSGRLFGGIESIRSTLRLQQGLESVRGQVEDTRARALLEKLLGIFPDDYPNRPQTPDEALGEVKFLLTKLFAIAGSWYRTNVRKYLEDLQSEAGETKQCPTCERWRPQSHAFCSFCGTILKKERSTREVVENWLDELRREDKPIEAKPTSTEPPRPRGSLLGQITKAPPVPQAPPRPKPPTPIVNQSPPGIVLCPNCRKKNRSDNNQCVHCGGRLI